MTEVIAVDEPQALLLYAAAVSLASSPGQTVDWPHLARRLDVAIVRVATKRGELAWLTSAAIRIPMPKRETLTKSPIGDEAPAAHWLPTKELKLHEKLMKTEEPGPKKMVSLTFAGEQVAQAVKRADWESPWFKDKARPWLKAHAQAVCDELVRLHSVPGKPFEPRTGDMLRLWRPLWEKAAA